MASIEIVDALDRRIVLPAPARRVVSLVPSETESVAVLAPDGVARLAGRTEFCIEPRGAIEHVPTCGGTKSIDVRAVIALAPDLVLANQEESSRKEVEALIAAGVVVHVSFPSTLRASATYLHALARMLGVDEAHAALQAADAAATAADRARERGDDDAIPVFVPIWRDPWMTFDGRTFASDILRAAGARNVFADRARAYPLAADLGQREPLPPERVGDRDTRYPRVRVEEIVERAPRRILLPDEPFAFGEEDARFFRSLETPARDHVELIDGKDLFWYGTRAAAAVGRLSGRFRATQ
jgi:ABC-type Fe3+-hydroxamate transport system substrate-binding protein